MNHHDPIGLDLIKIDFIVEIPKASPILIVKCSLVGNSILETVECQDRIKNCLKCIALPPRFFES